MKYCPWCGQLLKIKVVDAGSTIKYLCSKCNWKLREFPKPEPTKKEAKEKKEEKIVPVKEEEKPVVKTKPVWPFVLGAIVLIIVIIILVKIFLVK